MNECFSLLLGIERRDDYGIQLNKCPQARISSKWQAEICFYEERSRKTKDIFHALRLVDGPLPDGLGVTPVCFPVGIWTSARTCLGGCFFSATAGLEAFLAAGAFQ